MTEEEKLKAAFDAGVQAERDRVVGFIKGIMYSYDRGFSDGFSILQELTAYIENREYYPPVFKAPSPAPSSPAEE